MKGSPEVTDLINSQVEYAKVTAGSEEGQGTIEYLLVVGVLVVGIFGLMTWAGLGDSMNGAIQAVIDLFDGTTQVF
jgi:hypothetical protein